MCLIVREPALYPVRRVEFEMGHGPTPKPVADAAGFSTSGPAGRPSAHPELGRLRRIDDVSDGSACRHVETAMALSSLKILAFLSEAPSGGWNAMAK